MPVSDQANQMSMLQNAMKQMQMQQQLAPLVQKLLAAKQQLATPQGAQMAPIPMQNPGMTLPPGGPPPVGSGSPMLQQLMGGMNPMGGPQGPKTLGVNQPVPMQMPQADPQGLQQLPPIPPEALSGAGPQ